MKALILLCFVVGCLSHDAAKDRCETQADCLDGFVCNAGTCELPGGMTCTPKTCQPNQCNTIDDGCGGSLDCGHCTGNDTCGGGGMANMCGPMPDHCTNGGRDANLGETDVDCGGTCGGCANGLGCATTDDCATGTCDMGVCAPGRWKTIAPMPTSRTMLGAAQGPDGLFYAIGGYAEGSVVTGVVEAYDPMTDSWTTRAPMPTPRYGLSVVVGSDGLIYAIGGESTYATKVEAYNTATNTWASLPSLPVGRYVGAAVAASDGKIYETGGIASTTLLGSVVTFTPGGSSWATLADPMTVARDDHAAATVGGKIYVVGGYDRNGDEQATFEYYQPGTAGWHTLPPMPTPRKMLAAAVTGGKIYVIGGNSWESQSIPYPTAVVVYDPAAHMWGTVASLALGRYHHAAVTGSDGKIYIFGGERDGDSTNTTAVAEVYTPD